MTTTTRQQLHPHWCELTPECVGNDMTPRHDGRTHQWYTEHGAHQLRVQLSSYGEGRGNEDDQTTRVHLNVRYEDAAGFEAFAMLAPDEAEELARRLQQAAQVARREALWISTEAIRGEQR